MPRWHSPPSRQRLPPGPEYSSSPRSSMHRSRNLSSRSRSGTNLWSSTGSSRRTMPGTTGTSPSRSACQSARLPLRGRTVAGNAIWHRYTAKCGNWPCSGWPDELFGERYRSTVRQEPAFQFHGSSPTSPRSAFSYAICGHDPWGSSDHRNSKSGPSFTRERGESDSTAKEMARGRLVARIPSLPSPL